MKSSIVLDTQLTPLTRETPDDVPTTLLGKELVKVVAMAEEMPENWLARESIQYHVERSGLSQLSPMSFNWNHLTSIYTLVGMFKETTGAVSLSTCRLDAIARDPGLAQLISAFGSVNITSAIEGISERICNFLQKSMMPEEFYNGMRVIINSNFRSIKLYYIYTGLENDDDLAEFEERLQAIDEMRKRAGRPTMEIRTSFTPLQSTLLTPLQFHGSKVSRSLKAGDRVLYRIRQLCSKYGFGMRLSTSIASSDIGQLFEFQDRRSAPILEYASLNGLDVEPRTSLTFFKPEAEITRSEFDKTPSAKRIEVKEFSARSREQRLRFMEDTNPTAMVRLRKKPTVEQLDE